MRKAPSVSRVAGAGVMRRPRLREAGREEDADKFAVRLGAWKSIVDFTQTQSEEGAANGALAGWASSTRERDFQ